MDKVQASMLLFALMGVVIVITIVSVKRGSSRRSGTVDPSPKSAYEKALQAGDRQAILREGRKYYSTLRKEDAAMKEAPSSEIRS